MPKSTHRILAYNPTCTCCMLHSCIAPHSVIGFYAHQWGFLNFSKSDMLACAHMTQPYEWPFKCWVIFLCSISSNWHLARRTLSHKTLGFYNILYVCVLFRLLASEWLNIIIWAHYARGCNMERVAALCARMRILAARFPHLKCVHRVPPHTARGSPHRSF